VFRPEVDIIEREQELLVLVDLPGVKADDIEIRYEQGTLTLFGKVLEPPTADRKWLLREYGIGDFQRSFRVGEAVDTTKIAADITDGVLTIHLPKVEAARSRTIPVRTA
jgi:HSP20 family protein